LAGINALMLEFASVLVPDFRCVDFWRRSGRDRAEPGDMVLKWLVRRRELGRIRQVQWRLAIGISIQHSALGIQPDTLPGSI